jgi:hypothetical protein
VFDDSDLRLKVDCESGQAPQALRHDPERHDPADLRPGFDQHDVEALAPSRLADVIDRDTALV